MGDELITALRKEAGRLGRLQSDKEHQTNHRRKTFRYRNHILTQAADRITELETANDSLANETLEFDAERRRSVALMEKKQKRIEQLQSQVDAVRGAIPWEWLDMANIKYGSEIFKCPYDEDEALEQKL